MAKFTGRLILMLGLAILPAFAVVARAAVLKADPAPGTLAAGKKVLVDDGSCPAGQIKELTGAPDRHSYRITKCIKRK